MDYSHFFIKDLEEISKAFCELSEEELEKVQEMVLSLDIVSKKRFVRLLIYRRDATRLLSFLNYPDLEIQKSCIRALKVGSMRKNLYASFKDEATFIAMFAKATEKTKQVLLECLVWNKDRPTGCLADRLFDNSALVLTPSQRDHLKRACSTEKYALMFNSNRRIRNAVAEMNRDQVEALFVQELYKDFKAEKKDLQKYLPFISHWWRTYTLDGKSTRVCDLILDIYSATVTRSIPTLSNNLPHLCTSTSVDGKGKKPEFRADSIGAYVSGLLSIAPIYVFKRLNLTSFKEEFSCSINQACQYIRAARLLGETEIAAFFLDQLTYIGKYNCGYSGDMESRFNSLKIYLSEEDLEVVQNGLLDRLVKEVEEFNPMESIVWEGYLECFLLMLKHFPREDPRMQKMMELLSPFELQFKQSSKDILFYGSQQGEIPLDFAYQQGNREVLSQYKTARQFEKVLCVKGNTFLNKKENSDREDALTRVGNVVSTSRDVRAVHRFIDMYLRTDIKFADINLGIQTISNLLIPDCLGLSPISAQCSGTSEEAAQARLGIVASLVEWAGLKKGCEMVRPLSNILCMMFTYASIYPDYQDMYCAMMKPLVQLLVGKKITWSWNDLDTSYPGCQVRSSILTQLYTRGGTIDEKQKEAMCAYTEQEKKLIAGEELPFPKRVHSTTLFVSSVPNLAMKMPAFSRVCVEMILSMLEQTEEVDVECVMNLLDLLLSRVMNTTKETTTKEEKVGLVPGNDRLEIVKTIAHVEESVDFALLREIFRDCSFKWEGCLPGLSALQTLALVPTLRKPSFLENARSEAPKDTARWSVREVSSGKKAKKTKRAIKKEERKDLYGYLFAHSSVLTEFQLRKGVAMFNQCFTRALLDDLNALSQTASVTSVALDVSGLKWCLDTLKQCYVVPYLMHNKRFEKPFACRMVRALSDENLLSVFNITRVFFNVAVQSAVLVISLNKSDKPVTESSVTSRLNLISNVLMDNIQALLLLNQELAYRKLQVAEKEITIRCQAPFLATFLQSVKEGTKQDMKTLVADDTFTLADAAPTTITLDISQNEVVGRMVELLFYNQIIGQYFNSKLPSVCSLVIQFDTAVIFTICRRLLVVSVYVPYASNLLTTIIRSVQDPAVLGKVVDVLYDAHRSLSVALLSLIFRVAAMPAMSGLVPRMQTLIKKIIEYVTSTNFQSTSAYVAILKWAYATLLQEEHSDREFICSLLKGFTKQSVQSEAGRFLFRLLMSLTYDACEVESDEYNTKDIRETAAKLNALRLQASEERRAVLKDILQEVVVEYDLQQEDEELSIYLKHLVALKLTNLPARLVAKVREVIEVVAIRHSGDCAKLLVRAVELLYAVDPEGLTASLKQGLRVYNALNTLPADKTLSVAKMVELGIPESYHKQLGHPTNCANLLGLLKENHGWPLAIYLDVVAKLEEETELEAAVAMVKVLRDAIVINKAKTRNMTNGVSVDVDKLLAGVKTMESWMFLMLLNFPTLVSFSKKVRREIFRRFTQEEDLATAGLLCAMFGSGFTVFYDSDCSDCSDCSDSDCSDSSDKEDKEDKEEEISPLWHLRNWITSNRVYSLYPALANI